MSPSSKAHAVRPARPAALALASLALVASVAGCAAHAAPPAAPGGATPKSADAAAPRPTERFVFTTSLDRDAPLVGKVWDTARGDFASPDAVLRAAATATYVLLGEKHDNPDHHALQARVLGAMVASGRKPALAWEMIETDKQGALDGFLAGTPTAEGLGAAVAWEQSGWPAWAEYAPIAKVGLSARLAFVAANVPHATARALVREGRGAMDAAMFGRLGLDKPLAADLEAALEQEMIDSHCGMLPPAKAPAMALAQRARDAMMADKMIGADAGQGAVLVAGAGHVQRDRGVPAYLAARRQDASILAVAFAEVDKSAPDPRAYAARYGAKALPFDYVWFTPRANDDDPCAAFRGAHEQKASR
jgi:uncharacterized iron-regulated protein